MIRFLAPVLIALSLARPLLADEAEIEKLAAALDACEPGQEAACEQGWFERCAEASGWTTQAMVVCSGHAVDYWDRALNRVYGEVMDRAPSELRGAVRDAQRAWITWRDARCGAYRFFEGTLWRPVAVGCVSETTRRRVGDLEEIRDHAL